MPRGKTLRPIAAIRDARDEQLLELALAGSSEAFDEIVARYRPRLLRYCAGLTRPERVDDAVQQTFISAWLALERGVAVRELRPWLFSIARNAAIDQLRLHRGELVELSPELAGGADPAAVASARGEVDDVLRAVSALPERQRTALLETAVHGRSTELVADEMGMSGGALRQLVHRARTSVRGMVASFLPGPAVSWFAQAGGEEGTRRLAVLIGGAGQGATAAALAATATVASVGAIGTGAVGTVGEPERKTTAVEATTDSGSQATTSGEHTAPALTASSLVTLPIRSTRAASAAASATEPTGSEVDEAGEDTSPPAPDASDRLGEGTRGRGNADALPASSRSTRRDGQQRAGRRGGSDHHEARTPRALAASSGPKRKRHRGAGRGDRPGADSLQAGGSDSENSVAAPTPSAAEQPAVEPAPVAAAEPEPEPTQSTSPGGDGTAGSSSPMSSS